MLSEWKESPLKSMSSLYLHSTMGDQKRGLSYQVPRCNPHNSTRSLRKRAPKRLSCHCRNPAHQRREKWFLDSLHIDVLQKVPDRPISCTKKLGLLEVFREDTHDAARSTVLPAASWRIFHLPSLRPLVIKVNGRRIQESHPID